MDLKWETGQCPPCPVDETSSPTSSPDDVEVEGSMLGVWIRDALVAVAGGGNLSHARRAEELV